MSLSATLLLLAAAPAAQAAQQVTRPEPIAVQASASVRIVAGTQIRFKHRKSDGENQPQIRDGRDGTLWFEFS